MQMLYDSDSFVVLHLQPDLGLPTQVTLSDGATTAPALPRHGFEIVDKRSGRHVYLDGSWAELFQQQISAWHHTAPTQEEVEDMLDNYTGLAGNPVMLH